MNCARRMLVSASCLVLLLSMSACQQGAKVVVRDKVADEAAIRHVLDEISRTFNAGDYDGMFALYRDDVVVVPPGAPDIVGKAAWREGLKALPTGVTLRMRFDTQELEVDGDLAYERGTYVLEGQDATSGQFTPMITGRHIHIFRREADGSWKGWRLMENSAEPAAVLPAAPPAAPAPTRTFGE